MKKIILLLSLLLLVGCEAQTELVGSVKTSNGDEIQVHQGKEPRIPEYDGFNIDTEYTRIQYIRYIANNYSINGEEATLEEVVALVKHNDDLLELLQITKNEVELKEEPLNEFVILKQIVTENGDVITLETSDINGAMTSYTYAEDSKGIKYDDQWMIVESYTYKDPIHLYRLTVNGGTYIGEDIMGVLPIWQLQLMGMDIEVSRFVVEMN